MPTELSQLCIISAKKLQLKLKTLWQNSTECFDQVFCKNNARVKEKTALKMI
jgi:hypothetical protein